LAATGAPEGNVLTMRRPHCCPLCNDFSPDTTLQNYEVTAKVNGENRHVTGLAAFICHKGHIFFLRRSDLVFENLQPPAAVRKLPPTGS
jgi:hypothetical protein